MENVVESRILKGAVQRRRRFDATRVPMIPTDTIRYPLAGIARSIATSPIQIDRMIYLEKKKKRGMCEKLFKKNIYLIIYEKIKSVLGKKKHPAMDKYLSYASRTTVVLYGI